MLEARLHDGSIIEIEVAGEGPALLLPINPRPVEGEMAEMIRQYGNDPALGLHLMQGLSDAFRVIVFDYEGQCQRIPKPKTLTPANVSADFLAVADAAGVEQFAYYGYSWLALSGLQLAIRTQRLSALIMGGFPPLEGPYEEMLAVTRAAHKRATNPGSLPVESEWDNISLSPDQTQQFVTLYEALRGFDERAAQSQLTCPRLCFVGSADEIPYGKNWGDVLVNLGGPVLRERAQLEALGWDVRVLEGLDHTQAMQAEQVLPILRPWLTDRLK